MGEGKQKSAQIKQQKKLNKQQHSVTLKSNITMSLFDYGVGGNEAAMDTAEKVQDIQENKTLLVAKLTSEDTVTPEITEGLKTVEDVFRKFQPQVDINHETIDGQTITEQLRFANVGDFNPKNLMEQSAFLNSMSLQQEQYNKIIRQLKANKVLRSMLENNESKKAFIEALKAVAMELNDDNQ